MVVADANASKGKEETSRRITRRRGACNRCRVRKVRCDGKRLCSECQRLGFDCQYVPTHRSRPSIDCHEVLPETPISQQMESPFDNDAFGANNLSFLESEYIGDIFAPDVIPYPTSDIEPAEFLNLNAIPPDDASDAILPVGHDLFDRKRHVAFNEKFSLDSKLLFSTQLMSNSYSNPQLGHSLTMISPGDQKMSEASDADALKGCIYKGMQNTLLWNMKAENGDKIDAERFPVKARQNNLIKDAILEGIQQHCSERRLGKNDHLHHTLERLMMQNVEIYPSGIFNSLNSDINNINILPKLVFDCIDVCMNDQLGASTFLDRSSLENVVHEVLGQFKCSTSTKALAHMVLALGIHFLQCEGRYDRLPDTQCNPLLHFNAALKLKQQLLDQSFSVLSLQTLVTMTYFGLLIEARETRDLLSNCIQYSQTMRLNRNTSINALCPIPEDRSRVKKAIWFLYTMEQRFCLRTETFPLLNHDFVDHEPPKPEGQSVTVDWLSICCHHATLCASILQEFYGQKALQSRASSHIPNFEEQLCKWMQRLPSEVQLVDGRIVGFNTTRSQERRTKLHIFCLYYEILLAVYAKQTFTESSAITDFNMWPSCSDQQKTTVVKKLLEASHQFTVADVRLDLSFYQLARVASCILAVSTIRDGNNSKDLSYLSMAVGFFGRMAIGDIDGPQEEVTEIVRIARQLAKESHDNQ